MARIFYQQDCDLQKLAGKPVAIIGYGSQGHAHALNLKESGVNVVVGLYEGSKSWAKAEAQGMTVMTSAEAAKAAAIGAGAASRTEVGVHPGVAELVIAGPLVFVGQDLVGLVDFLEVGLGLLVAGVQVGMVFFGQLPVCFFQFIVAGGLSHPQHLVVVTFCFRQIQSPFALDVLA